MTDNDLNFCLRLAACEVGDLIRAIGYAIIALAQEVHYPDETKLTQIESWSSLRRYLLEVLDE